MWSYLSRYLDPNQTFVAAACLYAISTAAMTANLYAGSRAGLVFLARFFSPFVATIMQWSGQQVAALAVLSISSVALHYTKTPRRQVIVAGVGQVAGFLSYAGVAPLILLQLACKAPGTRADLRVRLASLPMPSGGRR